MCVDGVGDFDRVGMVVAEDWDCDVVIREGMRGVAEVDQHHRWIGRLVMVGDGWGIGVVLGSLGGGWGSLCELDRR